MSARTGDWESFNASTGELTLTGAWPRALRKLIRVGGVHPTIRNSFAETWVCWGDVLRDEINDDLLLLSSLQLLLPSSAGSGVIVYRGDSAFNRQRRTYGMAWTSSLEVARDYAILWTAHEGGSVLVKAFAPPEAIIYAPALEGNIYGEDEYIVDRRRLRDARVIERFLHYVPKESATA